ncbi:hypothetical protein HHK36_030799 [Tetracentron sinense]|uniref:Uncharacterized protein n=1 Tax=Tetracentron sinense TaxID=13715 RepID=A0A835CYM1_TETSI|nr:hypothetical protein HHK36_030799 [Tetracentron sinense]
MTRCRVVAEGCPKRQCQVEVEALMPTVMVLELGIVVHSVIIGISLGASESPKTIKPLVVALTFHQFFEGKGLGGCVSQAKFKCPAIAIMALFFSLTTPVGIAIGISNVYDENSPTALIVERGFQFCFRRDLNLHGACRSTCSGFHEPQDAKEWKASVRSKYLTSSRGRM